MVIVSALPPVNSENSKIHGAVAELGEHSSG